jgi:hypothetical protein
MVVVVVVVEEAMEVVVQDIHHQSMVSTISVDVCR